MSSNNSWKPGDRVEHATYGSGTVLEFNDRHAVVHFDDHGRKKFASNLLVLTAISRLPHAPVSRRAGSMSERATDAGYENLNEQVVIRTVRQEDDRSDQQVYVLRCRRCGAEYGVRAADIQLRRCPACMGGPPGLAV